MGESINKLDKSMNFLEVEFLLRDLSHLQHLPTTNYIIDSRCHNY